MIKVGDKIRYQIAPGAPKQATIRAIEVTKRPGDKYGVRVEEVDERLVRENLVVFDLDDGHFCYSHQVILDKVVEPD